MPRKSRLLAEFIGICLGDGYASGYQAGITLNSIADRNYLLYVEDLARNLFPGATFSIIKRKKENAIDIRINSKTVVIFLKGMGVIPNAKTIPDWILKEEKYTRACVRGLFDTEGSISFKCYRGKNGISVYKQLNFRNSNMILMGFVKNSLINLGLKPTTTMRRSLYLSNHDSIDTYRKKIGFSNPKLRERSLIEDISAYLNWKTRFDNPAIT